jgi:hypothetical protein
MRKILILLILFSMIPGTAWISESAAQLRVLPKNGKRGVTGAAQPMPAVVIGREKLKLAPGGVIFDTNNRTIVHSGLPVGADVWYQLNNGGEIQRIYILTPFEQSRLDQAN